MKKPEYKIPLMKDINKMPCNGITVVSTFSGGGGSSTGYRMAGCKVLLASEFIPHAQDTYRANHKNTHIDTRDIRNINGKDILKIIKLKKGDLCILDGSPPCASFSTSGNREQDWGKSKKYSDTKQRTDDLFYEYVRLLQELQPKVFVAENVSGLIKGIAKGYFIEILDALKRSGYKVECRLLNAQWLGVPQQRQRLIFIGVREDLKYDPVFPEPLPYYYTVKDAIPWIDNRCKPDSRIYDHSENIKGSEIVDDNIAPLFSGTQLHKLWKQLKVGQTHKVRFNLSKAPVHKPCWTITATGGNSGSTAGVTHPYESRKFSIGELKRICGYPDDYILTGSYTKRWERLGRSVPPMMMKYIADAIVRGIFDKIKQKGK